MAGIYNSGGIGVTWVEGWTLLHTATSEAERNIWEELFFDGRDTPGNVNLLGNTAYARQGDVVREYAVALTGNAATTAAGTLSGAQTYEFVVDSFTGTNGTAITSHTGELGATWTDSGGSGGTAPTIQTNRLKAANNSTGNNFYTASGTPADRDYVVGADIYMTAYNGSSVVQLDVGVVARYSTTGGGQAYAFGWDAYYGGWAIYKMLAGDATWGGGPNWINQTDDVTRAVADARTIEFYVTGDTTPLLRGWVNGVLVLEVTDSTNPILDVGVAGVFLGNAEQNFTINRFFADDVVPAKVQLTGQLAFAKQALFYGLFDTPVCVTDTFTNGGFQWLYDHVGEVGATWTFIAGSDTGAFINYTSDDVWFYNNSGDGFYNTSGTPDAHALGYAAEAEFYLPTDNYTHTGLAVRQYYSGQIYNYSLCLRRNFGNGELAWSLRRYNGGYTELALSTEGLPTTAGVSVTARIEVYGVGSCVQIRAWVDGALILTCYDTSTSRITTTGNAGLHFRGPYSPVVDTLSAGVLPPPPVGAKLTGKRATVASQGFFLSDNFAYDTFSSDPYLTWHTGESGPWTLAARGGTNEWFISGGVAYPDDTGNTYYRTFNNCYSIHPLSSDYVVEAALTSHGGNGWYGNSINTGIATRMSSDGNAYYAFGIGYSSGPAWVLAKSVGGITSILATSTISSADTTIKLVASGTGATVTIKAYVGGSEVISYSDTATDRIVDIGKPGLVSLVYAGWPLNVNTFKAYYDTSGGPLVPTGRAATTAQGSLTPVISYFVTPTGRLGTTGYGALLPVIDVVPLGRAATTGYGAVGYIVGGNVSIELPGLRATTAKGDPYPTELYGALTGRQATTGRGDILGATYLVLDGQQAVAQAGGVVPDSAFVIDTFTQGGQGSPAWLTGHTGERGATWTVAQQTNTDFRWVIYTSYVTASWTGATLGTNYTRASGAGPTADYVVEANYTASKNTGGAAGYITEGIAARMNSGGTAGYIFGRNPYDGLWQIDKVGTGTLATAATGTLGSFVTYRLTMIVTGSNPTVIKGYVDGVEKVSYSDSTSPVTAAGYVGLFFRIAADTGYPYEQPSGYFEDLRAWPAGDAVTVRLYGQRAVAAQATLDPSLRVGVLTGYAATATRGNLTPRLTVLTLATGALAPKAVRSSTTGNPDTYPGDISTAFVTRDGSAYGVGEWYDGVYNRYHARSGIFQISLLDQTTFPWVDDGSTPHLSAEEINTQSLTRFPRDGTVYALLDIHWYNSQNTVLYGWASMPPDGDIQSAFIRDDLDANSTLVQRYLGWQEGPLYNSAGHRYVGPEVTVGVFPYAWNARDEWTNRIAPLGFYAVGTGEALLFYPRRTYAYDTGVTVHLVGQRVITDQSYGHTPLVESNGLTLTGLRAVTTKGDFPNSITWGRWDATVPLVGQLALANQPFLNGMPTGHTFPLLGIDNSQTNAPPAYRRLKDGVWGDEVVLSGATGAAHNWAYEGLMCVTHSGYSDIIYVTYLSSVNPVDQYPMQIGVIVMDSRLGTVHSHTLTALTGVPSNLFHSLGARGKLQSETVTLSNGTSVTQFMMTGHVLHLSWTYATRLSPTVTSKSGPSTLSLIPAWETLEVRGDEVYHVLFTSATNLYINDAASTGSTWTNVTNTVTGDGWSDGGAYETISHDYLSASQQGYKSWLYDHRERVYDNHDGGTYWLDFWAAQSTSLTVASAGATGRVKISTTPNRALTGYRATTGAGAVFPLVNGDAHASLVGRKATAIQRCIAPPRVSFVYDSFTDANDTYLTAHTGEIGATWAENTYASAYIINPYNELKVGDVAGTLNEGYARASGVPPTADYGVRSTLSTTNYTLSIYTHCISQGVGARVGLGQGYFFGHNYVDHKYYLTKNDQTTIIASADAPTSPYASHAIRMEVAGNTPTQIRCYIDEVLVIEYWDSTACVTQVGSAAIVHFLYQNAPQTWYDIEAYYFDPSFFAVTGLSAAATGGTLTASHTGGGGGTTISLAQLRATTSQGYLGLLAGQLAGNRATLQWGTLGIVVDDGFTVDGQRATTAQGVLVATPAVSASPLGRSATMARGTLTPVVAAAYWNFIAQAVTNAGVLDRTVLNTVQLTGLRANTAQGGTVPTAENSNAATGRAATLAGGVVVPVLVVSLTGARAAGGAGGFVPLLAVTPAGRQAVSSQGTLQLLLNIFLTGRAGTCAIGSVGYAYGSTAMLSGVYSKGELGDATKGLWKPGSEHLLWVLTEPEDPEIEDPADEEYVRGN